MKKFAFAFALAAALLGPTWAQQVDRVQAPITTQNLVPAGACTVGSCVTINAEKSAAFTVQVTGTYTGALSAQVTTDGATWVTLTGSTTFYNLNTAVAGATITSGTTGLFKITGVTGVRQFRITGLAAMTGSALVTVQGLGVAPEANISLSGGAGDASAANQVTGNASLASIDTKTPALGQAVMASSSPVVIASNQSAVPVSGTVAATQSGTWTARVQDGAGTALTSATRGAQQALSVQIVDGSGNQVTTFGGSGGTASTVGSATPATATAIGGNDGTNMQVPRVADLDTGAGSQYALITSMRLGASGGGVELVGGAGAVSAGVLRTTQASDSPMVTNTGAQADSVCGTDTGTCSLIALAKKIAANISASTTQLPADGTGQVTMANSFPVVIASDQSNVPTNVAQINGVTVLMGAGNTGTGSQRVTIATDQAAHATYGHGATGSAVPANATMAGGRSGANLVSFPVSDTTAPITMSTATTTQMIALSGSTKTFIDNLSIMAAGATNVTLVYGTGSNCATSPSNLTGAYPLVANVGFVLQRIVVPAGQALCVTSSAAVQVSGHVTYTQFAP